MPIETAKAQDSEIAARHMRLGKAYYDSKNLEASLEEYLKALEILPENTDILFNIGGIYQKLNRFDEAIGFFSAIIEISPQDNEAKKQLDASMNGYLNELKKQASYNQEDSGIWSQIAMVSSRLKLHRETIDSAQKALSINPNLPYVYSALADAYMAFEQVNDAFNAIEKAFALKPDDDDIFNKLQEISLEKEKYRTGASDTADNIDIALSAQVLPDTDAGLTEQIRLLVEKGDWESAIALLEMALIQFPENSLLPSKITELKGFLANSENSKRYYDRGIKNLQDKNYRQALEQLTKAEEIKPNRLDFRALSQAFVDCYMGLNSLDQALNRAKASLEQNPTDLQFRAIYAQLLFDSGKKEQAIEEFKKILDAPDAQKKANPGPVKTAQAALDSHKMRKKALFWGGTFALLSGLFIAIYSFSKMSFVKKKKWTKQASKALESKKWRNAVDALENLTNIDTLTAGEKNWAHLNLGEALLNIGQHNKAIIQCKKALVLNPNNREAHLIYARSCLKSRLSTKDAMYEYKLLLEAEPDNQELILHLASLFADPNKKQNTSFQKDLFPNDGEAILVKALKFRPEDTTILRALGDKFINSHRTDKEATTVYDKLLRLDYENNSLRRLLAEAYYTAGNYLNSIREIKHIFRTDSSDPKLHDLLIASYEKMNNIPDLLVEYENLMQADPEDMLIAEKISTLRLKYSGGKKQAPASSILQHSTIEAPSNNDELWDRANALMKSGQHNQGIAILKGLIESEVKVRESSMLIISAFIEKGLVEMAWEQYCATDIEETSINPKEKAVIYALGRALEDSNKLREAWEIYDFLCRVDISYEDAFERFEELDEYIRKG